MQRALPRLPQSLTGDTHGAQAQSTVVGLGFVKPFAEPAVKRNGGSGRVS